MADLTCEVPGCDSKGKRRYGLCRRHYQNCRDHALVLVKNEHQPEYDSILQRVIEEAKRTASDQTSRFPVE